MFERNKAIRWRTWKEIKKECDNGNEKEKARLKSQDIQHLSIGLKRIPANNPDLNSAEREDRKAQGLCMIIYSSKQQHMATQSLPIS